MSFAASIHFVMRRFLYLLALYTVLRLLFFIYNIQQFSNVAAIDIFTAFAWGLRFDISAILKLNLIFFIIWLVPTQVVHQGRVGQILGVLFSAVNFMFLVFNIGDVELINFTGQRLTANYFAITKDIFHQVGQLLIHYWYLLFVIIIAAFIFYYFMPQIIVSQYRSSKTNRKKQLALIILFLFFSTLGLRGGLQNKPLRPAHAFAYNKDQLGQLTLNSSFTILSGLTHDVQNKLHLLPDDQVSQFLERDRTAHFNNYWVKPQNVVVILVESLALEYIGAANEGHGYTPFIDSLSQEALFFTQFFANGRRSIEAIPSILSTLPSFLNTAFMTSNYQGIQIINMGEILSENGYSTAFFHGAENGSMFFDSYAARSGFSKYFGMNEYPHSTRDHDGAWGVFDEPFLQFSLKQMSLLPQPFASFIFTLSSHQPYTVPEHLHGQFENGTLEIHESIGYADYALAQFFKSAQKTDWYYNTLFVITADHTQKSDQIKYQDKLGHYRVPLILFHPQLDRAKWPTHQLKRVAQHVDILPTILDVLNISQENLTAIGSSVFSRPQDAFVVNRTQDNFWYLSQSGLLLEMDFAGQIKQLTEASDEFGHRTGLDNDYEVNRFKAYVQYVVNGIIENKLTLNESVKSKQRQHFDSKTK